MLKWKDWEDRRKLLLDPYIEWFRDLDQHRLDNMVKFVWQVVPRAVNDFTSLNNGSDILRDLLNLELLTVPSLETGPQLMMSPKYMTNEGFADWWDNTRNQKDPWLPSVDDFDYSKVDEDTIVAGIIDVGMAFGHRRFRLKDGRTRVLGSWQQGAPVITPDGQSQAIEYLPFGTHLYEKDINEKLKEFSVDNDLTAPLDQDGFNRAAGLVDFETLETDRLLTQRASHGSHVMGLIGGADPSSDCTAEFSRRVRFIIVTLPPACAYGDGGAFLDYYLIYGLRWIIEVNARVAEKSGFDRPLPLVTNISFGKHAGSKDDAQPFVKSIGDHHRGGRSSDVDEVFGRAPFHAVFPAGNSNLTRTHARFLLGTGKESERVLDWNVKPDDETSNFIEIWCTEDSRSKSKLAPLAIEVVPPGQGEDGAQAGKDGQVRDLSYADDGNSDPQPLGRIYCEQVQLKQKPEQRRFRYLVCLAPDRYVSDKYDAPPAGRWKLCLTNKSRRELEVRIMVQTDQATLPGQPNARRSYLDDPTYRRFTRGGRIRDTYKYAFPKLYPSARRAPDLDRADMVKRHGTLNSYAANSRVATIAGHRASDGRPADFSSSGWGVKNSSEGRGAPTVSLPTDDGYAHPGVLSDGTSDGSAVAMRGTSFASAAATRMVLDAWLTRLHDPYGAFPINYFLVTQASRQRPAEGWFDYPVDIEKVGAGRIDFQDTQKFSRFQSK